MAPVYAIIPNMDHAADAAQPFAAFADELQTLSPLRVAICEAYRTPEAVCVSGLLQAATLAPEEAETAKALARCLIEAVRLKRKPGGVQALVREYALSTDEGVALMCLAEALLRIPDNATRDALIRDKIGGGDWQSHLGSSPSLFVNAATWGLLVAGQLSTARAATLSQRLTRLLGRAGEPLIRKAVDLAMRLMGEQFVAGQSIDEALTRARKLEAKGFSYSYDMLGEAAATAEAALHYFGAYKQAIATIGAASKGRGVYQGPGISIKLSALHPRYGRAQRGRVLRELLPRLTELARLAREHEIGLNIDAEEADRLDLSLDLLETLCLDPALAGWNGIGFVVQAYQKRALPVLDYVIDLGRRSGHRLMVRLVKGAYWDSEIKRAQTDGQDGFPVYTRKIYTDISYLGCARKLLAAPDAVYPQFATHNALTLASVYAMAAKAHAPEQYEFQCLHGMGEALYEEIVGRDRLDLPCRIYAPVGTHESLLAYLVRRLLENGANSSFVNQIADPNVSTEVLLADPVSSAKALPELGLPHEKIVLPKDLYQPERANSDGLDLSNELVLTGIFPKLSSSIHRATPLLGEGIAHGVPREIRNPADQRDLVGEVEEADAGTVERALTIAVAAASAWAKISAADRAACLERAADLLQERMSCLIGLLVREAGKTISNAVGEVREAIDFLRYYAAQARGFCNDTHAPLGPVACISPWNFPLAIFVGQIGAALAAGNVVLAKPAEETPLVAALAVTILRQAGVPPGALQYLPGAGDVGAALVADTRCCGVVFTGSNEVARQIQSQLAQRVMATGGCIPLIAETGGQNVMIVDSSALAEQVVADVLQSAFDSAGQRCSALRVLCLQEDVAGRILEMLKAAMAELAIGNTGRLATDIGPMITAASQRSVQEYVEARRADCSVHQLSLPGGCREGFFVGPAMVEIRSLSALRQEIFGPVLHVLRFDRERLAQLIDGVNAMGYGLTFGLHSRIAETMERVESRIAAGNIYINRNMIGAVVGVQPFGGHGLSGTGPKAGGPLYLRRLLRVSPGFEGSGAIPAAAEAWVRWLRAAGSSAAEACAAMNRRRLPGMMVELPGPVGEQNIYKLGPRGRVLCIAETQDGLAVQIGAALATGNVALVAAPMGLPGIPAALHGMILFCENPAAEEFDAVLFEGGAQALQQLAIELAERRGPIVAVYQRSAQAPEYPVENLLRERSISINIAAAGGNASLMSLD